MITVANAVAQGAERLAQSPHADRAKLDTETLLLHVTGANKSWLLTHGDDSFTDEQSQRYAALMDRRFQGEPIQYITGEAEFYGLTFRVTPDVLIPRPETEHLVEQAIVFAHDFQSPRIVDIGTGSGAIAIALAHHLPQARITSIDISEKALAIAKENAARNQVADRIRFLHGDLLTPVERERFDLVVSNPPYVPETDRDTLSVEVRDHEPPLALFAGADGLDMYRRLIPAAHEALLSSGLLLMEIGYGQSDAIRTLLAESDFGRIRFVLDLQGIPRVACATSGADNCGCGDTVRAGM